MGHPSYFPSASHANCLALEMAICWSSTNESDWLWWSQIFSPSPPWGWHLICVLVKYPDNCQMDCNEVFNRWILMTGDPLTLSCTTSRSNLLLSCEMSQHLLDKLPPSQTMYPNDFSSSATIRLTFAVSSEMSWQVSDGLPWHFLQTLMSPSGWIV